MKKSIVVVGDGWAAMGLTAFLSRAGHDLVWVAGSGSRIAAPMPGLEVGSVEAGGARYACGEQGASAWTRLASLFSIDAGTLEHGSFTREFRNKAFREPTWTKAPTPEDRKAVRDEVLWEPERVIAPVFEGRFDLTLPEIEAAVRENLSTVRRIEGVPVQSIQFSGKAVSGVALASGETIACDHLFYADRWEGLSQIEGMPKGLTFTRKRDPMGVLQATFTHDLPMAGSLREGFFGTLHREAGEEVDRHVWGYFTSDGSRSYWTLCLSPEEAEDNHAIAKKLRRMKNALDKMFSGSGWLPEGKSDFLSNVKAEQVRFEEAVLFSGGEIPKGPQAAEGISGLSFLTDGYGPAASMTQVEAAEALVGRVFEGSAESLEEGRTPKANA